MTLAVYNSSHPLVFAIRREIEDADIERHLQLIAETRGTPRENLAGL